jgi:hypothetical protein
MEMLFGALAFWGMVFAQFAAVIAAHDERMRGDWWAVEDAPLGQRTRLIWICES